LKEIKFDLFELCFQMMPTFVIIAFLPFLLAESKSWPATGVSSTQAMPNIEISLAPPAHPLPQVAAAIGAMDATREKLQALNMDKLQRAYNAALDRQKAEIGTIVGRAMRIFNDPALLTSFRRKTSFLGSSKQETDEQLSVKVNVMPAIPPDASITAKIQAIENKRNDQERSSMDQAMLEMNGLTDVFLNEFAAQVQLNVNDCLGATGASALKKTSSFIQTKETASSNQLPKQANVRVVASDVPYPTVASFVQDMETRRDAAENLAGLKALDLELSLLKAGNAMAKEALNHGVARIMAQYASIA